MKKVLVFSALGVAAILLAGCTESPTERTGERPGERQPSASPPTAPGERPGSPMPPPRSDAPSSPGSPLGGGGAR